MKTYITLILLFITSIASIASAQLRPQTPSRLDPPSLNRDAPAADEAALRAFVVGTWEAQGSRGWKGKMVFQADGKIASGGIWTVRGTRLICDYGGGKKDVYKLPAKDGVIEGQSFRGTTLKAVKVGYVPPAPKAE